MLKLIRMEIHKFKLAWYVKGAVLTNILIVVFMLLLSLDGEEGTAFADSQEVFYSAGIFVRAAFIIFASVLVARFIIEEYRSKTISVLFMYPLNRRSLMLAKIILICGVTFFTITLSNIFVVCAYFTLNHFYEFVSFEPSGGILIEQGVNILLYALAAAGISLLSIFFGMAKRSTVTTIVSAILVVALVSSTTNGFSLGSIPQVPLALGVLGILLALWSCRNVEKADII